jgi:hypothetical protein
MMIKVVEKPPEGKISLADDLLSFKPPQVLPNGIEGTDK